MSRKPYISFFITLMFVVGCLGACAADSYVIDIDLRGLDSIKDDMEGHNIVSFYTPQKVNGEDVSTEGMGISGSGIYYYDEQIVKIKYYVLYSMEPKGYDFPSAGQARVVEDSNGINIICRLSEDYGCVISSNMVSKEELINIANSFETRDEP